VDRSHWTGAPKDECDLYAGAITIVVVMLFCTMFVPIHRNAFIIFYKALMSQGGSLMPMEV
jgi:hypothetical protein